MKLFEGIVTELPESILALSQLITAYPISRVTNCYCGINSLCAQFTQLLDEPYLAGQCTFKVYLLSRQTESVRDHKFHSGYAHSSMVYR